MGGSYNAAMDSAGGSGDLYTVAFALVLGFVIWVWCNV